MFVGPAFNENASWRKSKRDSRTRYDRWDSKSRQTMSGQTRIMRRRTSNRRWTIKSCAPQALCWVHGARISTDWFKASWLKIRRQTDWRLSELSSKWKRFKHISSHIRTWPLTIMQIKLSSIKMRSRWSRTSSRVSNKNIRSLWWQSRTRRKI